MNFKAGKVDKKMLERVEVSMIINLDIQYSVINF